MTGDEGSRDLIADYLEQLRRGLRVAPGQTDEILAEAEDHLRETAAAGLAVGMTEREAHEAAISSFGPVNAVTRAHLARANGGMAALAMAGWKLVSLLLLAGGTGSMGLLWQQSLLGWHTAVLMAAVGAVMLAGFGLARRRWPGMPLPGFFPAVAVSVFGAIGLVFLVLTWRTSNGLYDPRPLVAVCLAVALGYAVRLGQARLRQR